MQSQKRSYEDQVQGLLDPVRNNDRNLCIIILDFKQNVLIGGGLVEESYRWGEQSERTVLGFVVLYRSDDGSLAKRFVNFVSNVLSHDGLFVIDAIKKLVHQPFWNWSDVSFWSDCGPHFRNGEVAHSILVDLMNHSGIDIARSEWNLFGEGHGKNLCDTHFSRLSKWLLNAMVKGDVLNTSDLITAWEEEVRLVNLSRSLSGDPPLVVNSIQPTRTVRPASKCVLGFPRISALYNFRREGSQETVSSSALTADGDVTQKYEIASLVQVVPDKRQPLKRAPVFNSRDIAPGPKQRQRHENFHDFRMDCLSSLLGQTKFFDRKPSLLRSVPPTAALAVDSYSDVSGLTFDTTLCDPIFVLQRSSPARVPEITPQPPLRISADPKSRKRYTRRVFSHTVVFRLRATEELRPSRCMPQTRETINLMAGLTHNRRFVENVQRQCVSIR